MGSLDWSQYHNYMGFSESQLRSRYAHYVRYFEKGHRVADLGCGGGVFLELLRESGIEAVGVDSDPGQVEICRRKGLSAETADLLDFVKKAKGRFGGIFCSHVVEHLASEKVDDLARGCFAALTPGGVAVIVTPNPEALHVHLLEFWRDPTHVRPYSKEALGFLFNRVGFTVEETNTNPMHNTGKEFMTNALRAGRWWTKLAMRPITRRLDRVLSPLGLDQGNELYVVLRKPSDE